MMIEIGYDAGDRGEPEYLEVPNPGSEEAIEAGCICPVLDNEHGKGYMGLSGVFVYTQGCPVHCLIDGINWKKKYMMLWGKQKDVLDLLRIKLK